MRAEENAATAGDSAHDMNTGATPARHEIAQGPAYTTGGGGGYEVRMRIRTRGESPEAMGKGRRRGATGEPDEGGDERVGRVHQHAHIGGKDLEGAGREKGQHGAVRKQLGLRRPHGRSRDAVGHGGRRHAASGVSVRIGGRKKSERWKIIGGTTQALRRTGRARGRPRTRTRRRRRRLASASKSWSRRRF